MRRLVPLAVLALLVNGCGDSTPSAPPEGASAAGDGATPAATAPRTLMVAMRAAEEVPASDSRAYGFVWLTFNPNSTVEVKARIWNPGCETFVAGHVHIAPPGSPGPVVIPLFSGSVKQQRETLRGRAVVDPALVQAILADPGAYYVNYHSLEHPPGAIRGQLSATPDELDPPDVSGPCA
jgi:hypothetical protein